MYNIVYVIICILYIVYTIKYILYIAAADDAASQIGIYYYYTRHAPTGPTQNKRNKYDLYYCKLFVAERDYDVQIAGCLTL